MSQSRYTKDRSQRFKIEVIKKKVKRIQSTPQKQSINFDHEPSRMLDRKLLISSQGKEPPGSHHHDQSNAEKHKKSNSEYWNFYNQNLPNLADLQTELGPQPIIISSCLSQNTFRIPNEQSESDDSAWVRARDKKMTHPKRIRGQQKLRYNPFENLNIMKCQSICLLQANRRNRGELRPSKLMHGKESSASRRKMKIGGTNSRKLINLPVTSDADLMYGRKLKAHLDYLFKINFSNKLFMDFDLKQSEKISRHRVYVGWGNNHQLVRNSLKSRFWVEVVDRFEEPDIRFYWTCWPARQLYEKQKDRIKLSQEGFSTNFKPNKVGDDVLECNQKILMGKSSQDVENYILTDGYVIPFPQRKSPALMTNHLWGSSHISQKKKLFHSIFKFYRAHLKIDPFSVIPITYNVTSTGDPEYKRFMRDSELRQGKVWIVKPGEDTNRGEGIFLAKTEDVGSYIMEGARQTYIIQSYIERPLLYHGRKFDVRHFILVTSINGYIKAYWYKQGYVRTSSQMFDLDNLSDKFIHLTNDAIQQHSKNYGAYEAANKISYNQLQRYLEVVSPRKNISLQTDILDKVRQIICNVMRANYKLFDPKQKQANFELFGIDFMIDRDFKPWLIEINENPCLETNCQLLCRLIPSLVENTFRLCLDPLFPPLNHFPPKQRSSLNDHYLKSLKYEIIFDSYELEKNECQVHSSSRVS